MSHLQAIPAHRNDFLKTSGLIINLQYDGFHIQADGTEVHRSCLILSEGRQSP